MTNTETLSQYAERAGLILQNPEQDGHKIRNSTSTDVIYFRLAACGHKFGHGTMIKCLKNKPKPIDCKKCKRIEKAEEDKQLRIDYEQSQLCCLNEDCGRVYQRCAKTLTKNLKQFRCYCQMDRPSEALFYDYLVENFGLEKVHRSFSGYSSGTNHSSDMSLIDDEGKLYIIELDDASHRCSKNRLSDIGKVEMAIEMGLKVIHVDQQLFDRDPEGVIELIWDVLECNEVDTDLFLITNNPKFYSYLFKAFEEITNIMVMKTIE